MLYQTGLLNKPAGNIFTIIAFLLFPFAINSLHGQQADILLKGGHVIDPKNKIDAPMDIAIAGGKISEVAKNIPATNAKKVIDVSGMYVTPGLIDMHVHVFNGTEPDAYIADGLTSLPPDVTPLGQSSIQSSIQSSVVSGTSSSFREFKN